MRALSLSFFAASLSGGRIVLDLVVVPEGQVHDPRGIVEQGASGLDGDFHVDQHIPHGGQLLDGDRELLSAGRIVAGDAVGGLRDAHGLGGDLDAGAVHQRRDVGDQAALPLADQHAGRIVEEDLAGGRAVDAELVFEPADVDGRAGLAQKQTQAHSAAAVGLASCQHQEHVAAAVRDEPLHAVEEPVALAVLIGSQLDGLEVRAGVGLGEHHRAGDLALGEERQVLLLDLLGGEGVDRVGDALEAEDVAQRGVGSREDIVGHRVDQVREIQPAEAVGQGEAHDFRLGKLLDVLGDSLGPGYRAVFVEGVALAVHALGPRRDEVGAELAERVQHHLVVADGFLDVVRCVVEFLREAEALFERLGQRRQVDVPEQEPNVVVIRVKVSHALSCH